MAHIMQLVLNHLPRYVAKSEFRFNRYIDLASLPEQLTSYFDQTTPMPYAFPIVEIG